jgi:hypothetical protein
MLSEQGRSEAVYIWGCGTRGMVDRRTMENVGRPALEEVVANRLRCPMLLGAASAIVNAGRRSDRSACAWDVHRSDDLIVFHGQPGESSLRDCESHESAQVLRGTSTDTPQDRRCIRVELVSSLCCRSNSIVGHE